MNLAVFGFVALLPMMIGPPPAQERSIVAGLCNGGTISIPLRKGGDGRDVPDPCPVKACHAGACRKTFDLEQ